MLNNPRRTDAEGKKRVGAVIVTNNYFASARYEVRAKLTRYPENQDWGGGVVNGFWTFHSEIFDDSQRSVFQVLNSFDKR